MKELKNELLENYGIKIQNIKIMVIFTSIVRTLFKSKIVSNPRKVSAVQWSRRHLKSAVQKTAGVF